MSQIFLCILLLFRYLLALLLSTWAVERSPNFHFKWRLDWPRMSTMAHSHVWLIRGILLEYLGAFPHNLSTSMGFYRHGS